MIDIAAARNRVERMSGFTGNRYTAYRQPVTTQDVLFLPNAPYLFEGQPVMSVSDPADLFFDTYNGTGYLHQWRPGDPVPVNHEGYSQASGATHKCGCKGGATCKCNASGKPCPCKQGKPCPCKKSNASGFQDTLTAADQGVQNIIASGQPVQPIQDDTPYWVIGGVVVLAIGAYLIVKFHKKD